MKVGTYRRVSTDIQREEGVSLHTQSERLKSFADSQGWTIVQDYADEGFSAKDMNRPDLQRLIRDIESKKIDVLLVYRLDRLVRSVSDLHHLLKIMDKHDVKFKSCTEVFDTTSATGRLFITIIATLAQWERETIAERVFDNLLERSEMGLRNGAPAPYGYQHNEKRELVLVKEEAKHVKLIFEKYATMGTSNIAKLLNKRGIKTRNGRLWSDFTVRYVLQNPLYAGYVRWNRRSLAKGKFTGEDIIRKFQQENFEPIITKETWDEVQAIMQKRSFMAFRSDNFYPFTGIARCPKCGARMTGAHRSRGTDGIYRFYKCSGRYKRGICDMPMMSEEGIEKAFLEFIEFPDINVEHRGQQEIDRESLKKELDRINGRIERTKELYIDGDISKNEYIKRLQILHDEEDTIQSTLRGIEENVSQEEMQIFMYDLKTRWHTLDNEVKKATVSALFKSLTFNFVGEPKKSRYPNIPILTVTDYEFN